MRTSRRRLFRVATASCGAFGVIAALAIALPAHAAGTVVTVAASADSFVHAGNKTTNYGKSSSLSVYGTPDVETFLAFALPAAPAGQTLTAAALQVRTTTLSSAGSKDTETVKFAAAGWNETTVTYNNRPAVSGSALGTLTSPNAVNTSFTISLDATRVGDSLGTTATFALLGSAGDGFFINSREAKTAAARPTLNLTFSPNGSTDNTPPDPPSELEATVSGHDVDLEWEPSNDDTGTVAYDVYRSATNGFTPGASTLVGSVSSPDFEDPNRPTGDWFYVVTARDAAGNVSDPSVQEQATVTDDPPPPPPDTTLTSSPTADTYVHGVNKNTNYGTDAALAAYGNPDVESFLRFTLPSAPSGQVLSTASLRLQTSTISSAGSTNVIQIRTAANDWSESTTTWNTRPTVGAIIGSVNSPSAVNTPYDIPLDADTMDGFLGSTASLAVLGTAGDGFWFNSREARAAATRPLLTLQFVSGTPDTQPPTQPTDLAASVDTNRVTLNWTASTDDNHVARYDIHRGTASDFTPSPDNQVGTATTASYTDTVPAVGTYYYRVVARDGALNPSDPSDPATAVVDTMPAIVKVAGFGDSACAPGYVVTANACRQGDVAADVQAINPDYIIAAGDLQYDTGTYAQFMGSWDVTFGSMKSKFLPVVGNHEFADSSTLGNGYFDYWLGQGVNSGPFGERGVGNYTKMLGSWEFIALNSECTSDIDNGQHPLPGGCGVGSPEYQWLSNVLDANTAQCTIVAFHRPRWSTGPHGPYPAMGPMWDLMVDKGVDVAVSGHDHDTQVFKPIGVSGTSNSPVQSSTGIQQFVVGTGGKNLSPFPSGTSSALLSATQARDSSTFGAIALTLKAGSYDWVLQPIAGQTYHNVGTTGAFSGMNVPCH